MKSISGKKVVLDLTSDFNLIVYSNDCEIDSLYSPYLTIYAYEGSKAAEYAYDYNIRFVSLGSSAEAIPISDEDEPYLSYLPDTDEGFTEAPQRKPLRSEMLSGLEPDTTYNLYVMKQEAEDIGSDNLIYVCQKSSSHDGDLSFEYAAEGETSAPCIKAVPCSDAAQFALSASKTLLFAGETAPISANRNNVTLYSSDESIAALSENGGLTAIQPGDVTIIGVDSHGNIAELAVTVTAPLGYITDDDGYYTELDDMYISTGETRSIGTFREGMVFVSSDDETASVNEHGEVKALRKGDASITVTDANGDSTVINVHVHEPIISGMAMSLLLSYDTDKLELISVADGKILGSSSFTPGGDVTAVPYKLNWDDFAAENNTGTGTLATASFRVKEGASGEAKVTAQIDQSSTFDIDYTEIPFEIISGSISITSHGSSSEPTITVSSVSAAAGQETEVPVMLECNPGVAAMSLALTYDTDKLELLGASDGKILGSSAFSPGNDLTAVPYKLNWDDLSTENNTGNGILVTLRFMVRDGASGEAEVCLKVDQKSTFNIDFTEVPFEVVNGSISINFKKFFTI